MLAFTMTFTFLRFTRNKIQTKVCSLLTVLCIRMYRLSVGRGFQISKTLMNGALVYILQVLVPMADRTVYFREGNYLFANRFQCHINIKQLFLIIFSLKL